MLGASTNLGNQRCSASNGEALLKTATELIGIIQVERSEIDTALVGAELARDDGLTFKRDVDCYTAIAS
jgi:hypothetical protein